MATNLPTNVPTKQFAQFDSVATELYQTFNTLIAELIARRDSLLLRLSQLREDYISKETTRKEAIEELEQQMSQLSMKVNINRPIQQQATEAYKQGLQQLQIPAGLPSPQFLCQKLNKLKSLIADFGEVVESEVPDYTFKKEPVLSAGKMGTGENELNVAGLAIDEDNQLIYIADYGNKRIQIVSFEGQFIDRFGQDKLDSPLGIVVTKKYVFITDAGLHALLQFDKKNYQLLRRTGSKGSKEGHFNLPRGLCIDEDIIVTDCHNDRLSVFSRKFKFIHNIGIGQLSKPRDVKLIPDSVVVVIDRSPKCLHLFSRNGNYLRSCISQGEGPECLVNKPYFFCIDPAGNMIISDYGNHTIKIISQSEQLIHTIGSRGSGKGRLIFPFGICITKLGTIFVVSLNHNYVLQCF